MSKVLDWAKNELELARYDISKPVDEINSVFDYANACARNAYEMLEIFEKANHSGFSAVVTLQLFNRLAKWQNLTPLTNDPDEWNDICNMDNSQPSGMVYQSKRCPSCFSDDGLKTYYDIDEECNYTVGKDENGATYKVRKRNEECKRHELKGRNNKMSNCENCKHFEMQGIEAVCTKKHIVLDESINFEKECENNAAEKDLKLLATERWCSISNAIIKKYKFMVEDNKEDIVYNSMETLRSDLMKSYGFIKEDFENWE